MRLVVYDGLRRAPTPVFNEKILCGLGRGVATTGKLNPEGMERALGSLRRFRALSRQIGAREVYAVATAAAREAENGQQFVDMAEEALGAHIDVLSGKEEARLAAMGVMAGITGADGLVGDLGGGSLELIDVGEGQHTGRQSPCRSGPLRLMDMSGGSAAKARDIIDELSRFIATSGPAQGPQSLCGGRHLAQHRAHPHGADALSAACAAQLHDRSRAGALGGRSGLASLFVFAQGHQVGVAKPHPIRCPMARWCSNACWPSQRSSRWWSSIYGVREGLLYSKLPKRKREADALLSSCWDFCCRYARSPEHELELADWTDKLFSHKSFEETDGERRLRHAACLLADIGWRAHPDYRAERSLGMISQAAFVDIDHAGRIFLALTIFYRYEGEEEGLTSNLARLVDDKMLERARLLSDVFRLAYIITAAMPGVLPKIGIDAEGAKSLILRVPKKYADLIGERVEKRLTALAGQMGRTSLVEIV